MNGIIEARGLTKMSSLSPSKATKEDSMSLSQTRSCELCNEAYFARGYCKAHYSQLRHAGKIETKQYLRSKTGICSFEKCVKKSHAKVLCSSHYNQFKRTGTLKPIYTPIDGCSVKGCTDEHQAKGYCSRHYDNLRHRGGVLNDARKMKKREETGRMLRKHPLYRTWDGMRQRCGNPKSTNYHLYGGRGISVCERWQNSFAAFLDDMGERPHGMTLDRINNNGNYEPGNVRWATPTQQIHNRRINKNNTSGYPGVSKSGNRWVAEIWVNYKKKHIGSYKTLDEAISARKKYEAEQ